MLTNNITYLGKYSFELFNKALFANDMFEHVQVFEGIKNDITLPVLYINPVLVDDSCNFSDASTLTMDPRVLSTCAYKMNFDLCISDIEATFLSERMRNGTFAPVGPEELLEWVRDFGVKKIGNDVQSKFWGSTASDCLGVFGLLGGTGSTASFATSGVIGVTAAAGVTAGNVMAELAKVYAAIPATVKSSVENDLSLWVSADIRDAYLLANASTTTAFFTSADRVELRYLGIPLRLINTSATRKMVAATYDNLVLGTDLLDDKNEIRVIDMRATTGDNKIRFVARVRIGQQVRVPSDAVYYSA